MSTVKVRRTQVDQHMLVCLDKDDLPIAPSFGEIIAIEKALKEYHDNGGVDDTVPPGWRAKPENV